MTSDSNRPRKHDIMASSDWDENHLRVKWPDRSLALMLRDFLEGDQSRAQRLRNCRTKKERLALCKEWHVPYVSHDIWERTVDTGESWFRLPPVERSFLKPYCHKTVVIIASQETLESSNGSSAALERIWDFSCDRMATSWTEKFPGLFVRPQASRPGTRVLFTSDAVFMEIAVSQRLVFARQLMELIEEIWGLRPHQYGLQVEAAVPHDAHVALSPAHLLRDFLVNSPHAEADAWPVHLVKGESQNPELYILEYAFDNHSEFESYAVQKILWKVPVEGAKRQVIPR